jgi:hypothetical protein
VRDTPTDRQYGDLISFLPFFQNKESRLTNEFKRSRMGGYALSSSDSRQEPSEGFLTILHWTLWFDKQRQNYLLRLQHSFIEKDSAPPSHSVSFFRRVQAKCGDLLVSNTCRNEITFHTYTKHRLYSSQFMFTVYMISRSWDRAVGIATGYELDDRRVGVRVSVRSRIFSSLSCPDRLWGTIQPPIQRVPG